MLPIVEFLTCQILSIIGLQVETKRILSFDGILTNLRKYCLQMINLQKLIFLSKNWPNDTRVGCKSPFGLVELIEKNLLSEKN